MLVFKINFEFNSNTYSANVQKIPGDPVQYLVFTEKLVEYKLENPLVIVANKKAGEINFSLNGYPELRKEIVRSVRDYCWDNKISLIDN